MSETRCAICGADLTHKASLYDLATGLLTCGTRPCSEAHYTQAEESNA